MGSSESREQELDDAKQQLQTEVEKAKEKEAEHKTCEQELRIELANLEKQESVAKEATELRTDVEKAKKKEEQLQAEPEDVEHRLQVQVEAAEKQEEQLQAELEDAKHRLRGQVEEAQEKEEQLQAELEDAKHRLQVQVEAAQEKEEQLQAELEDAKHRLQGQVKEAQEKEEQLQAQLKDAKHRLQAQVEAAEIKAAKNATSKRQWKAELDDARQQLQTEVENAKEKDAEHKIREQELRSELANLEKKAESVAKEATESRTDVEQAKKKERLQAQLKDATHRLQAQVELAEIEAENATSKRQWKAELDDAKQQLQTEVEKAKEKDAEHKTREQKLRTELESKVNKQTLELLKHSDDQLLTALVRAEHAEKETEELWMVLKGMTTEAEEHKAREQNWESALEQMKNEHEKVLEQVGRGEAEQKMEPERAKRKEVERKAREERLQSELEQARQELEQARKEIRQLAASQRYAMFVWEWETNDGVWEKFSLDNNELLKGAFLQGQERCEIIRDGIPYTITLAGPEKCQYNQKTHKKRTIRFSLGLPQHWGEYEDAVIEYLKEKEARRGIRELTLTFNKVMRPLNDKRYLFSLVLKQSSKTHDLDLPAGLPKCPTFEEADVREVYQVMNYDLLDKYETKRHQLKGPRQDGPGCDQSVYGTVLPKLARKLCIPLDANANEQLLLHGTAFEVSQTIATSGWDTRVANDGLYGRGTYFAVQSCKAHQYAKKVDGETLHTMIIARVALGKPSYAEECDPKVRQPPRGHDSVIAKAGEMPRHPHGSQAHKEFIIFQHDGIQAYPEYILRYTL